MTDVPVGEAVARFGGIEMYVCEIDHVFIRPNVPHLFRVHPDCKGCATYFAPYAQEWSKSMERICA